MSSATRLIHNVGPIYLQAVQGWADVTSELEEAVAPFTLARPEGKGVLQISTAAQARGKKVEITLSDLEQMLIEFCDSHGFSNHNEVSSIEAENGMIAASSVRDENQFLRIWYWTNGQDVVLATYSCADEPPREEITDCEAMVRSFHV